MKRRAELGTRRLVDDDGDGQVDEELLNGRDDDGDGEVDEDLGLFGDESAGCEYWPVGPPGREIRRHPIAGAAAIS